jgi:hypothetical protein
MAAQPNLILDDIYFQIRYSFGHTYLDRCGQTLVDIERAFPGWIPGEITPSAGKLINPKEDLSAAFGPDSFTISAKKPDADLSIFRKHASGLWKTIKSNLGLSELVRIGVRFYFLQPRKSMEDSEEALARSTLNIKVPDSLSNYTLTTRHMITILVREHCEYRVELRGITRTESLPPVELLSVNPRILSKGQRDARIEIMKRREAYMKDPMYAILLDVDCASYDVEPDIRPDEYISLHYSKVMTDFVPIIKQLRA